MGLWWIISNFPQSPASLGSQLNQVVPVVPHLPAIKAVVREHNHIASDMPSLRQSRQAGPSDGTSVVIPFREDDDSLCARPSPNFSNARFIPSYSGTVSFRLSVSTRNELVKFFKLPKSSVSSPEE